MTKLIAYLQLAAVLLCIAAALATLINLMFIVQRSETISVVNTIIGQGVLIIAASALARILFKKAMIRLKSGSES